MTEQRSYEYSHIVTLEETNALGNVYYTNYFVWQGRCRETFLRDYAVEALHELGSTFVLATTHASCDFYEEVYAFDEVKIRMTLIVLAESRITMRFDYLKQRTNEAPTLTARGRQQIVCMRLGKDGPSPMPFPESLKRTFARFAEPQTGTLAR